MATPSRKRAPTGRAWRRRCRDRPVHADSRVHRKLALADQLQDPVEMIRVGVCHEDCEEWLLECSQTCLERGDVRVQQVRVDGNDAAVRLEQVLRHV